MESDNYTTLVAITARGLVNTEQFILFSECYCTVNAITGLLGCIANVINIKTFTSMGLEDGVAVSFLALSFSDFAYLLAMIPRGISGGFMALEMKTNYKIWFPVEPYGIFIFFANVSIMLYTNTVLITTFLAVARCMCVAKPLHFKNAFTRKRSVWILSTFTAFTVFGYIPIMYYMGLVNRYDARTQSVRPYLWISPHRELAKDIIWGIRDTFLAFTTQFVVVICVIVMARSLRQASAFRQSSTSAGSGKTDIKNSSCEDGGSQKVANDSRGSSGKLSGKDLQVVQQVILISAVYIACNTPKIMITAANFVEDDFTLGKRFQNMYVVIIQVSEIFQMFNSSINVFIYYRYNTKFRKCFDG